MPPSRKPRKRDRVLDLGPKEAPNRSMAQPRRNGSRSSVPSPASSIRLADLTKRMYALRDQWAKDRALARGASTPSVSTAASSRISTPPLDNVAKSSAITPTASTPSVSVAASSRISTEQKNTQEK